ncbi:helix-turn-helix domain-containing protein [Paenibacillus lemnae]|nr:AraC family transcriptional regulator [Paenibacillus lemnae]
MKECSPSWEIQQQTISFYDLVFVLEGSADYIVNGEAHHVQKGDLLFIKPQSVRSATTTGMVCAAVDFLLTANEKFELPTVSHWEDFTDIERMLKEINYDWLQKKEGYKMKCQALLILVLHKLLYEKPHQKINIHVEVIKRYIVDHYDQKLTVSTLARVANISTVYCGALFKMTEGTSISAFINQVRIHKAASLLESGEYNVGEVAERTGFKDVYYFSSTFKRLVGVSPKTYQNRSPVIYKRL